jgi:pimeloyl-ACP methyl ester carboxylesterase
LAAATERAVRANGVDLCVQTFGRADDPTILLVMGAGASMLWWPTPFCEQLAAGGRFVIRYDQRDTGRTAWHAGERGRYTLDDLAADALAVLDAFGIASAHLVGFSLGGVVAHLVAVEHPARVASLTLISTTPGGAGLPPVADQLSAHWEEPTPDWADRDGAIEYLVRDMRAHASRSAPFDETVAREFVRHDLDRTLDVVATMTSDGPSGGITWRERLGELRVPTLVVHGDEDPMFPLEHGRALARKIPGAELLVLEHVGHELPARVWDVVVLALLRHTADG